MNMLRRSVVVCVLSFAITPAWSQSERVSTGVQPLPMTEARNAAVGFALTQTAFTVKLIDSCQQLADADAALDPMQVFIAWRQRNEPFVEASRGWMAYVQSHIAAEQGEAAGAKFKDATMTEFLDTADAMVAEQFKDAQPEPVCEKWLRLIADQRIDLAASAEFGQDLSDILKFHTALLQQSEQP